MQRQSEYNSLCDRPLARPLTGWSEIELFTTAVLRGSVEYHPHRGYKYQHSSIVLHFRRDLDGDSSVDRKFVWSLATGALFVRSCICLRPYSYARPH
jgi:hypothetical protein